MKKIFLFLSALLPAMGGGGTLSANDVTYGEETTIVINANTGTFTTSGSSSWRNTWTSTSTDPQVTLTAAANNMQAQTSTEGTEESTTIYGFYMNAGGTKSSTYTLACSTGYVIKSISFRDSCSSATETITFSGSTYYQFDDSGDQTTEDITIETSNSLTSSGTIYVTSPANSVTYTVSGSNNNLFVTDFSVVVAPVESVAFTVSTSTGTLSRSGTTGNTWNNLWTSSTSDPTLTITTSSNNMEATSLDGGWIDFRAGSAKTSTYTLAVTEGYVIKGYSFSYYGAQDSVETITFGDSIYYVTTTSQSTGDDSSAKVSLDDAQSLTFTIASNGANANTSGTSGTDYNSAVYITDFYVYVEEATEATLTYHIYLGEESEDADANSATLIDTITETAYIGYSLPTTLTPNVSYYTITSTLPTGTVSGDSTYSLYAATDYPFTPTESSNLSLESADATWYLMYMGNSSSNIMARLAEDNNYVSCYASGTSVPASLDLSTDLGDFLWAFVPTGTFGEFYVYNAGAGGYLTTSSTSSGTYAVASSENTTGTAYKLVENTSGSTAGFALVMSSNTTATLNLYGGTNSAGYVRIYNNASTATASGSLINVLEITEEEGFEYVFGDDILDFITSYGTEYTTYMTSKTYVGLPTNLSENLLNAVTAYQAGTVSGMEAAFSNQEYNVELAYRELSTDQLYRIQHYGVNCSLNTESTNYYNGAYMTYSSDKISNALQCYDQEIDDVNAVWQFIAYEGDGYTGYYLYLPNQEAYIGPTSTSSGVQLELVSSIDDAGIYQVSAASGVAQYNFLCQNTESSYIGIAATPNNASKGVDNRAATSSWASNNFYKWYIEPAESLSATLSEVEDSADDGLGSGNYATIYYPWAVQVGDDVTAYALTQETTDEGEIYLSLGKIEDGIVPAATGVILKSEDTTAPTYTIVSSNDTEVESCLSGVLVDTEASSLSTETDQEDIYVFATGSAGLAFYWLQDNTTTLAANKAYYQKTSSEGTTESVIKFGFGSKEEDVETGIALTELLESAATESVYYDLSGRQVSKPTTGVYIKNGKKVILK